MVSKDQFDGVPHLSRADADLRTKVVAAMPEGIEMTAEQIAAAASMEKTQVLKVLRYLEENGAVIGEGGKYRHLSRDERG